MLKQKNFYKKYRKTFNRIRRIRQFVRVKSIILRNRSLWEDIYPGEIIRKAASIRSFPPLISLQQKKVLCVESNGYIYAFPLLYRRREKWIPDWKLYFPNNIVCIPTIYESKRKAYVIVATRENKLHCIDIHDGKEIWQKNLGFKIYSLASKKKNIFIAGKKNICAVKAKNGKILWHNKKIEGIVYSLPLLNKETLYCTTSIFSQKDKGRVYSIKNGKILWKYKIKGAIESCPVMNKSRILYVTCQKGWLYAIKDGKLLWKYDLGGKGKRIRISSPIIVGEILFVASNKLYTFLNN